MTGNGRSAPVTVHRGDCLQVMETMEAASFDAIVTDPPYSSGGFTESQKRQSKAQGIQSGRVRHDPTFRWFQADNMTTAGMVWLLRAVAVEAHRLLKEGGHFCVFTDWRMVAHLAPALESSGMRFQNLIVWDKGSHGLGWGFRPRHELILHYAKGKAVYNVNDVSNVIECARVPHDRRQHPTEKPVPLLRQILRVVSPIGGRVLDPFTGSGATLVAAREEGMEAVGIEIDPVYALVAEGRASGPVQGALA